MTQPQREGQDWLGERVRRALAPTPVESDRMHARLREETARQEEVAWRAFSRVMDQVGRERRQVADYVRRAVTDAARTHRIGMAPWGSP